MSARENTVCEFCEQPIVGESKVAAFNAEGQPIHFCTTTCYIDYANGGKA